MPVFNGIYLIESCDWFDDGIFIKLIWNHLANQLFTIPHVFNSEHQTLYSIKIKSVFRDVQCTMYDIRLYWIASMCVKLGWILVDLSFCWISHKHTSNVDSKHFHTFHIGPHINCERFGMWHVYCVEDFSYYFSILLFDVQIANFICECCELWAVSFHQKLYIVRELFIIRKILHNSLIAVWCVTPIKALKYEWHIWMEYAIQYFLCNFQFEAIFLTHHLLMKRWNWKAQCIRETVINSNE